MTPTEELRKLDTAHSLLVSLAEQGQSSAVLTVVASVLSRVPELDKPANDPYFWQQVVLNLNTLADTCQAQELNEDAPFDGPEELGWDFPMDTLDALDEYEEYDAF